MEKNKKTVEFFPIVFYVKYFFPFKSKKNIFFPYNSL